MHRKGTIQVSEGKYFDRSRLRLKLLRERIHDIDIGIIRPLEAVESYDTTLSHIARRVVTARGKGSAVIMMMGGHVIRSGVQRYIIDLMEKGYITCLSMNGSCVIHDYELARVGATTESVARYIKKGEFGLWRETGEINDIINLAYKEGGIGMGRAVGRAIQENDFPHKDISLLAACHRLNVPATVHVSIGCDIIHEHPNCDGAATGATSYFDFLEFADCLMGLEGGVVMNFGSAITAPEVYLKALSMARNVAAQEGREIRSFTTLVCDLVDLPGDFRAEAPKHTPGYYFRPWKTMLVRTVADGGESFYVKGRHADTIPALWKGVKEAAGK
jgi:hypothetical protein